jgi:hypothetical protein
MNETLIHAKIVAKPHTAAYPFPTHILGGIHSGLYGL